MRNAALRFVLIIGIANFFADFTYEGARGIVGPFLGSLGASAAIVGFVAGLGELMGSGLRSVSGYFADKSHRHWAFAFVGYTVNLLAVPALALATRWPLAATLGYRSGPGEVFANRLWKQCSPIQQGNMAKGGFMWLLAKWIHDFEPKAGMSQFRRKV